ncbi:four helix bundle protein [Lacinutrix sp. Hel_I_90]|uniref:four helix bundle protein n=1 Tax=Lacinutrix sp. Hel_I_90 TaxID=1249999 RepID=UPI000A88C042|nr:four helix bundle protein [Lacinutrix sp. Hel_I_90]
MDNGNLKNEMKFKFEDVILWQKGMDFGENMNILSKTFPKDEIFNLSSQLKRAADSIALNMSEGSTLQS